MGESKEELNAKRRKEYQERKALGICVRCGMKPAVKGRTACMDCLRKMSRRKSALERTYTPEQKKRRAEYKREYDKKHRAELTEYERERRAYYTSQGICGYCGQNRVVKGKTACFDCLEKRRESQQKHRDAMTDEQRKALRARNRANYKLRTERRIANHECIKCGRTLPDGYKYSYCNECRLKNMRRMNDVYNRRYRRTDNAGINRSEWVSMGICYTCGKPIEREGDRLCEKCKATAMMNVTKAQEAAKEYWSTHEHPWQISNRQAFLKIRP